MKGKILLPSLFFAVMLSPLFSSNYVSAPVIATDESYVVHIGDSVQVLSRTLVHEGQSKVVPGQIFFPDGSSKSGRAFVVTSPGAYQVVYSAFFGVEEVRETITYTCYRESGDFFTSSDSKNAPSSGAYTYNNALNSVQGAVLNLKSGQTFTLNETLDFNTFSPDSPFFEFIVDPSTQGESDLETFTVRLTDADDSSNYVDILISDSGPFDDDGKGCYILAGANNQYKVGYEKWGDGYRVHINDKYGTNVGSSFRALPRENPAKSAKLYFDYPTRTLKVSPTYGAGDKDKITDLDDELIYGSTMWDGFKNGRAKLSVFPTSILADSARLVVARAGSVDLSQLIFEDHIAPVINVNYDGQNPSDLPKASLNRPYKIFKASVSDNYDTGLPYSVSVTYNDTAKGKEKDVSISNGTFTPTKAGIYNINYRARDIYNNIGTKKVSITAIDSSQTMTASITPASMTQEAFSTFELPATSALNISGGSGTPKVTRSVVNSSGKEMPVSGNNFVPTVPGTYYAYYNATDYIGNIATAKITLTVTPTSHPVFTSNPLLPRILIKGHKYTLPACKAAETVGGQPVSLDTSIYINDVLISNRTFVAQNSCEVKYVATGSTGTQSLVKTIPVIDGEESTNQAAYFYGETPTRFETTTEQSRGILLTTNHDSSALFAGVLPYDDLYLAFTKDNAADNFEYAVFKFSEVNNPSHTLTFRVRFDGEIAYISALGEIAEHKLAFEKNSGINVYSFSFNNATKILTDLNHKTLARIRRDDSGNAFTGFTGGLYLDVSLTGVTGDSKFTVLELDNQIFGTDYFDAPPVVLFKEKMISEQDINAQANIPIVDVYDVLGEANVKLSVRAPDGSYKLNDVDATQRQTFTLDNFGDYNVYYRATDNTGNRETYTRKITVFDNVAPSLSVNNKLKEKYKLNSKIKIPEYSVSDNSNNYTVKVFLILPNDEERILLKDENGSVTSYLSTSSEIYNASFKVNDRTFKAEQYGTYKLRFVAYDGAYNNTVVEITFVVEQERRDEQENY